MSDPSDGMARRDTSYARNLLSSQFVSQSENGTIVFIHHLQPISELRPRDNDFANFHPLPFYFILRAAERSPNEPAKSRNSLYTVFQHGEGPSI